MTDAEVMYELTVRYRMHREFVKWLVKRLDEMMENGHADMVDVETLLKECRKNLHEANYDL